MCIFTQEKDYLQPIHYIQYGIQSLRFFYNLFFVASISIIHWTTSFDRWLHSFARLGQANYILSISPSSKFKCPPTRISMILAIVHFNCAWQCVRRCLWHWLTLTNSPQLVLSRSMLGVSMGTHWIFKVSLSPPWHLPLRLWLIVLIFLLPQICLTRQPLLLMSMYTRPLIS